MILFVAGVILFFVLLVLLMATLKKLPGLSAGLRGFVALIVSVVAAAALIAMSMVQTLGPGEVGRAYLLTGGEQALSVGYNFVAPWNRIYIWDMRAQTLNFTEGDAADDAFGAQTKNGDYLTAIANITVRIDPDRLDEYAERFGNERVAGNQKISLILKNELKRAMENALTQYETRELMNNKAKASGEARDIAMGYLTELPFVVETLWFVDFEASAEYEAAIRQQADIRMKTDLALLQESLNLQEAQNNKVKADGEAEVLRVAARAEADASEIRARNEATVAKIAAERDAEVKKLQAEADANVITTQAQADAAARVARDEAEARGATAIGQAYRDNPQLMEIKRVELEAVWAQAWNGMMPQFQGLQAFSFADLTDLLRQFVPTAGDGQMAQDDAAPDP